MMMGTRKTKNLIMIMGFFLFFSLFIFSPPANGQFFYNPYFAYAPFYNLTNFPVFQPLPLIAPPAFPPLLSRIANVPLPSGATTSVPALTPAGLSVTTLLPTIAPIAPVPTFSFTLPLSAIASLSPTLTVTPSTTSILLSLLSSILIY